MTRPERGAAYVELGHELRRIRKAAGRNTSQVEGYSSTHVSLAENGKTYVSKDFIETYVTLGGDREKLLDLYRKAKSQDDAVTTEAEPEVTKVEVTADSSYEEVRSQYYTEDLEYILEFDGRGVVKHYRVIARVRPLVPVVKYYLFGATYPADQRRGVLSVEESTDWSVANTSESEKGAIKVVVELAQPLVRSGDQAFVVSYHVNVTSGVRAIPILREFTRGERGRTSFRVQFTPPSLPEKIWWFRTNDVVITESDPSEDQLLPKDRHGFYHCEFLNISDEFVGICWGWLTMG